MTDRYDFDTELYFALREGMGRRSTWPYGVGLFGDLSKLIYGQLGREDALRFFRCVSKPMPVARTARRARNLSMLPFEHILDAVTEEFGDEDNERLDTALRLLWAAQSTVGEQQAAVVNHCVLSALEVDEPELAVV